MKKSLLLVLFFIGSLCFGQSADDGFVSGADDDFDAIFDDVEDITAEENDKINAPQNVEEVKSFEPYFKFYGRMKSELGMVYGRRLGDTTKKYYKDSPAYNAAIANGTIDLEDRRKWTAGYFDYENNLSFVARPDETFAIHGNLCTTFFPIQWVNYENSTLYYDYMAGPYCLFTAGKKTLNWGYVRIFNNVTDYSQEERLTTNIVADSASSIIASLSFPLSFMTATGVILYNLNSGLVFSKEEPPKVDELSYAGSLEFSFWQASFNFYGRRTAKDVNSISEKNPYGINNVVGFEAKKTIFNYDCYLQNTFRFGGKDDFYAEAEIITLGSYRAWDRWGYNAEFQNVYKIEDHMNIQRVAVDVGIKEVGPKRNLKLIFQWRHDSNRYTQNGNYLDNCWFKIGLVKTNILKHLDWVNGMEIYYRSLRHPEIYQARLASYFTLTVDY
ncbi:hypothetical protein [Treponema sp.]|uniref:hypothetical protein n=1 Tax=Treponema sp. TaxID=166 RepID=UPI00298D800A|nr:hypothetical protein [Treponema sp.]MCQ2241050.1 hypothetical protein [Treponema sp.]